MKHKFKVGDRVEILIDVAHRNKSTKGMIGTLRSIIKRDLNPYWVTFSQTRNDIGCCFEEDEIALAPNGIERAKRIINEKA